MSRRCDSTAGGLCTTREVFRTSLKLGLTSFGGPIAHLGYFERTYVRERRWLGSDEYASLVALCHLLPGPTSSQVGFLIGLHRAGWKGALAAWAGFTLPSALLMYGFAVLAPTGTGRLMQTLTHGLMLTAVVVVAQAVWNMARTLCPDGQRAGIALLSAAILIWHSSGATQLLTMGLGAAGGWLLCRNVVPLQPGAVEWVEPRAARLALVSYGLILITLPGLALLAPHSPLALAAAFYRAGALVFGGGHVVLPLLRQELVPNGWISDEQFLAAYGFAQGMPGPLFTVAAYLGAASAPLHLAVIWAALSLSMIFLPGLLVATGGVSLWTALGRLKGAPAMLAGINASVVGILAAALYDPVALTGVRNALDAAVAVVGLVLLLRWRVHVLAIAALCIVTSLAEATI